MPSALFITDPWQTLKPSKDSSIAMMRVCQRLQIAVWLTTAERLSSTEQGWISAPCQRVRSAPSAPYGSLEVEEAVDFRALKDFSVVFMRKDPPFDLHYVTALWLLIRAEAQGAKVINSPSAVLSHNEKLSILEFPEHTPPTMVTDQPSAIHAFLALHGDIIIKPLYGMGGCGIFRLRPEEINLHAILETAFAQSTHLMAQKYLPAISEGDKRVFVIAGKPQPFVLSRIPQPGETRGNLAAGGRAVAMAISPSELAVAQALAPILQKRGLIIVGLDMIGGRLTEINVTSPTCMVEIESQSGYSIAEQAITATINRDENPQ